MEEVHFQGRVGKKSAVEILQERDNVNPCGRCRHTAMSTDTTHDPWSQDAEAMSALANELRADCCIPATVDTAAGRILQTILTLCLACRPNRVQNTCLTQQKKKTCFFLPQEHEGTNG